MDDSPVLCAHCNAPAPDEGPCCAECFDKGVHLLPDDLQVAAAAALRAVGSVVLIGEEGYEIRGVVVGCYGRGGEDIWVVRDEVDQTHEGPAGCFRLANDDQED